MNAVNPVPSPASGAEPSMEEILASIRRIIADDQPLSSNPTSEPPPELQSEVAQVDPTPPGPGIVATPQFATPDGPARVMDMPHPLAPPMPDAPAESTTAAAASVLPQRDAHEDALRIMHDEPDARAAVVDAAHDHVYEGQFFEEALNEESVDEMPMPGAARHRTAAEEPSMVAIGKAHEDPPQDKTTAGLFSAATSQSLASAFNTLAISRLADDSEALRDLARDMMRPLLKDWLDAHLPGLVESIIREEIDRMSRRTR